MRITHPFHPRFGQEFDLLEYGRSWGQREVVRCMDEQGQVFTFPLSCTDATAPDPFVVLAEGRAWFRIEDLVRLAHLVEGLKP